MTSLDDVPVELRDELTAAGLDLDHLWDTIRRAAEEDLPDGTGIDPTSWATILSCCACVISPSRSPRSASSTFG